MARICALVVACALVTPSAAHAEDDPDLRDLSMLELMDLDVETVSSFEPLPVDRATADVVTFTRDDIEAMAVVTLADILRYVPGMDVSLENNGEARPAMRGLDEAPGILLVVDGIRLNDPVSGAAPFDLPATLIERVEVIRGPGSAMYGSNAVLGVVRVTTRTTRRMRIATLAGTSGSAQVLFTGEEQLGAWHVRSGFSYDTAGDSGLELERDALVTSQPDVTLAPGELGGAYERFAANLSVERGPVEIGALVRDEHRQPYAGELGNLVHDGTYENRFTGLYARLDLPVSETWRVFTQLAIGHWRFDDEVVLYPPGWSATGEAVDIDNDGLVDVFPDGVIERERYHAYDLSLEARAAWRPFSGGQLVLGVDAARSWSDDTRFRTNVEAGQLLRVDLADWNGRRFPEVDRLFAAPFAQWEQDVTPWLTVVAGVRLDVYDDFGTAFSPRLTALVAPTDGTTVRVMYGRAFRAPTFRELYNPASRELGNPDLSAEVVQSLQLKLSQRLGDDLSVYASGFALQIDDRIDVGETTSGTGRNPYFNLEGTRSAGGDVGLRWQTHDFGLFGSLAYHYTVDRVSEVRLARIAPLAASLVGEVAHGPVVLDVGVRVRGEREPPALTSFQEAFLSATGQDASAIVDVVLRSRDLPDGWWTRLAARNLFAGAYREVPRDPLYLLDASAGSNALPTQPRTFLLEVGKQF